MSMATITLAIDLTVAYFFTSRLHLEIRTPGTVPAADTASHFNTSTVNPGMGSDIHLIMRMETKEAAKDNKMSWKSEKDIK